MIIVKRKPGSCRSDLCHTICQVFCRLWFKIKCRDGRDCIGTGLLCAYQTGRFGLWAWLSARAAERGGPGRIGVVLAFAASELLYPLLFPWYLGATALVLPGLS